MSLWLEKFLYSQADRVIVKARDLSTMFIHDARAVELLKADNQVTVEKAMAIANDIRPFSAPRWVEV